VQVLNHLNVENRDALSVAEVLYVLSGIGKRAVLKHEYTAAILKLSASDV
jgi:hypothetical protein